MEETRAKEEKSLWELLILFIIVVRWLRQGEALSSISRSFSRKWTARGLHRLPKSARFELMAESILLPHHNVLVLRLHNWLISRRKMQITARETGEMFTIEKGERLFLLQSAKISPTEFNEVIGVSGFECVASFANDDMQMNLFRLS